MYIQQKYGYEFGYENEIKLYFEMFLFLFNSIYVFGFKINLLQVIHKRFVYV